MENGVLDVTSGAIAATPTPTGGSENLNGEECGDAAGRSLLHLHASVRALTQADDATRLQAIRSKRWITHHPAARVLTRLGDAFEQPPGDRMENLLLLAESGMGRPCCSASSSATMRCCSMQ